VSFLISSLPKKTTQLRNKNIASVSNFFQSDLGVLYLYGTSGSGKTYAIELFAKEYGYEVIYVIPPITPNMVSMLTSDGVFMIDKKLIIIDVGDIPEKKDLLSLAKGSWGKNKLVIIGTEYPKDSPMRSVFKNDSSFTAVKFYPFDVSDVVACLSMYAIELGASVSYETIQKIAEFAEGDMRAARSSLRALIASGDEDAVDFFLPDGEVAYFNNIAKLFSKNLEDSEDAVQYFGNWVSMMIIKNNIVRFCEDELDYMKLLNKCAEIDNEDNPSIAILGHLVGTKIRGFKYAFFKSKAFEIPQVPIVCSDAKKVLYFRGYVKWMEQKE